MRDSGRTCGGRARPRRICVVGGPGTGKTTYACQLARALGIHFYELDALAYERDGVTPRPLAVRQLALREILAQPTWIIEGIYLWWTEEVFRRADLIVWLDQVSWTPAAWRVAQRSLGRCLDVRRRGSDSRRSLVAYVRSLARLGRYLCWARGYYLARTPPCPVRLDDDAANTRAGTAQVLAAYHAKLVHCRATRDLENLLTWALGDR